MKKIILLCIMFIGTTCLNVQAKESIFYINNNDVSFTKTQYDFFTAMFYDGYQELMTKEEFNSYEKEIMDERLVVTEYLNALSPFQPYASIINTNYKEFKISKVASSARVQISVVTTWKKEPAIRSYDIMGARFVGVKLMGNVITRVSSSLGTSDFTDIKNLSNGFGVSIKLPSSGSNIRVSQSYATTLGGTIYASYQHATRNITLADSKSYTINSLGYGSVFLFSNGIGIKFDAMQGVSASV